MEVVKYPDPALFKVCRGVTVFGPELKVLLDSMWDTLTLERGIGLAANQVGLEYRMFVALSPQGERLNIVNPEIINQSPNIAYLKEGCLSAPGEQLVTGNRYSWVQLRFQDETGEFHTKLFKDIYSVCVQHELDHLNGKSHLMAETIPKRIRIKLAKKWGFKIK